LTAEVVKLLVPETHQAPTSPRRLTDFANASWISTRQGSAGRIALERICARAGFTPQIRYRSNDFDVVRSLSARVSVLPPCRAARVRRTDRPVSAGAEQRYDFAPGRRGADALRTPEPGGGRDDRGAERRGGGDPHHRLTALQSDG